MLIAVYLGPFYLGVWGFINLVIQYFDQFNLGISQSFNALGAIHKEDKDYVSRLFGTTLVSLGIIACFAALFFILNSILHWEIGAKYQFSKYGPIIMLAVVLNYFIPAFLGLLRIYGEILTIAIVQSLQPICVFLVLHFWKEEELLNVLTWTFLCSYSITVILCLFKMPVKIQFRIDSALIRPLLRKALFLFLYSASFYFILLSTKGLISANFSVEQFGYFTFAFALGNAILLLFKSFTFLIFPKVINRLAHTEGIEAMQVVNIARVDYVTLAHIVGHLAILLFPFFIFLFPQYTDTRTVFNLIALSLIVYTHCFGYQELLIAKGRDRTLGMIAFISVVVNVVIALFLIHIAQVSFDYVILSTMFAYIVFLTMLINESRQLLKLEKSFRTVVDAIFPFRLLLSFIVSIVFSIMGAAVWCYSIPLILFIIMNLRYLLNLKNTFIKVLNNPKITDI